MSDTWLVDEIAPKAKRVEYTLVLLGKSTSGLKPTSLKILTSESDDSKSMDTVADGISFMQNISYQA